MVDSWVLRASIPLSLGHRGISERLPRRSFKRRRVGRLLLIYDNAFLH